MATYIGYTNVLEKNITDDFDGYCLVEKARMNCNDDGYGSFGAGVQVFYYFTPKYSCSEGIMGLYEEEIFKFTEEDLRECLN